MIPYNLGGLIDKIGGNEFAEKRLDTLFTRLDAKYEDDWFAAGNEPDFQVPGFITGLINQTKLHRRFQEF